MLFLTKTQLYYYHFNNLSNQNIHNSRVQTLKDAEELLEADAIKFDIYLKVILGLLVLFIYALWIPNNML